MWSSETVRSRTQLLLNILITLALVGLSPARAAENLVPDSLGQWYKPQAKRQIWLHTMFAMRRELQAVREYAEQKDGPHMAKWAQRLADHYRQLPEMVPEWREETVPEQMHKLLTRAEAGEFTATLRAADGLKRNCRACHRKFQAMAALKHRWPKFDRLRVPDKQGGSHTYAETMQALSRSVNRIKIASEDQRWSVAGQALGDLRTQLDTLGQGCETCHKDAAPRERILGAGTEATLAQLDQALTDRDIKTTGHQLGTAAVQVCARCHGVHRLLSDIRDELFDD